MSRLIGNNLQTGQCRPEEFGRILTEKSYEFGGVTKYVYEADAASADLILVMEPQHQYALRGIVPQEQWDKIQLFMMYFPVEIQIKMDLDLLVKHLYSL